MVLLRTKRILIVVFQCPKQVRYPFRNSNCVLCGRCVRACAELWHANAIGFVGRGKDRHVERPLGLRQEVCKQCDYCILLCPMTITPCNGPIKPGEEYLCSQCESQLMISEDMPDACTWCRLGEGFNCGRYAGLEVGR